LGKANRIYLSASHVPDTLKSGAVNYNSQWEDSGRSLQQQCHKRVSNFMESNTECFLKLGW